MLDRLDFATRSPSGNLLLRLLREFGRDHVLGYLLAAIFLGLIALSNVSVAWLLRPVLNGMVSAEKLAQMRFLAFEALALFVMRGAATYGSLVVLSRIGNRIVATAQRRVFERLLNQNIAYFQDRHSSEFIARLAFAANGVRDALQLVIQGFARDLVTVTGLVFVMMARDPIMALGALLALPVAAFFVSRILKRVREFAKRSFEGSTQIVQTMGETVLGARIVRSFNLEGEMRERMSRAIRTVERSANRIAAGGGLATMLADSLAGCAIAFAIFYGSWRVAVQHARRRGVRVFPGRAAAGLRARQTDRPLSRRYPERSRRRTTDLRSSGCAARRRHARRSAQAARSRGPRRDRKGEVCVSRGRGGDQGTGVRRAAQSNHRAGRAFRRRKNDDPGTCSTILCAERRSRRDRRPGLGRGRSRLVTRQHRVCFSGRLPVPRHDPRQHRPGQAGRGGRRDRRGGAQGERA